MQPGEVVKTKSTKERQRLRFWRLGVTFPPYSD